MYVFVYGTLKQGYINQYYLKDAKLINTALSLDKYIMYTSGYPRIKLDNDGSFIRGEIYKIDDKVLKGLDMLESNGYLYTREERQFEINNEVVTSWIYITNPVGLAGNKVEPDGNNILNWE